MRIYTVHIRRHGLDPDRDIVLVKEGFVWPALLFTALWALWHRMWWVAAVLFAAGAAVAGLEQALPEAADLGHLASLVIAVVTGLFGNDLRRWTLDCQSFVMAGVVAARERDSALRRFLDDEPALARDLALAGAGR